MPLATVRPSTLYAWKGPSLLIVNPRGECGADETLTGYYFREARFLRTLRLLVDGEPPWLCEACSATPCELAFTFVYPEVAEYGGGGSGQSQDETPVNERGILQRALAIRVRYVTAVGGLTITTHVRNHSRQRVDFDLAWELDADFADIQEAQGRKRQQRAEVHRETDGTRATFTYLHEQLRYRTTITGRIETRLALEPQESRELTLRVDASEADGAPARVRPDACDEALAAWRDSFAMVSIPGNRAAERVIASNIQDLSALPLLDGAPDEWLAHQAGIPLYPALFGRDTLTAGWQAAWVDRGAMLEASLSRLARMQSDRHDDWHDEEPGRLPYQVRLGPLALLNLNPYRAYYADYATPLMFVIALGHAYAWSGEKALLRRHFDTVRRILDWARSDGDKDRDGYLEYQTRSSKGTKNQGWKDSGDAIVYPDGSPVPAPLGTCELQGYWYAAQQLMSVMCFALGARGDARAYWRSARALKKRFNRDWWIDDRACVALALDPDKRPVPAVSSNIGHCVATGIVDDEHLPLAVERLFEPDMFTGWGIRTLSCDHRAYNPLSYHCGSVWAVEQATIAFGLRRFGFDDRALELSEAVFDLARLYEGSRIPETIGGYSRDEYPTPGAYPHANPLQLWNASAFPLIVHTILGLQPVAPLNTLVVGPALPEWLPEVILRNVRLGAGRATIRFWRDRKGRSHAEAIEKSGAFHLLHQPPPESLTARARDRMRALVDTVVR